MSASGNAGGTTTARNIGVNNIFGCGLEQYPPSSAPSSDGAPASRGVRLDLQVGNMR